MDAAQKLLSKTAFFLAFTLVVTAPAMAQTPTLILSQPSVSLPAPGGVTSTSVNVTSSIPGSEITFCANKGANESWYNVSPLPGAFPCSTPISTPTTLTIQLLTTVNQTLTGTVTLTNSANSANTAVLTVNYVPGGGGSGSGSISPNPASLSFTLGSGLSSSQNVTLSTTSTAALTYTASPQAVGTSPVFTSTTASTFTVSQNFPATLTVTANATGLVAGTFYQNNIAITPTGGVTTNILVTLQVGSGGGTSGTLTVSSNQLFFSYPASTFQQFVTVNSTAGGTTFNATATSNGNWLTIGNGVLQVFSVPVGINALAVNLNTSVAGTLGQGTYNGTIVLANPFNSADTTTISVQLTVSGGTLLNLVSSKSSVQFNSPGGATGFLTDSISLSASNGLFTTVSVAGFTGGNWLQVPQLSSASLPSTMTLTVNPSGLPAGTYQGSVSVNFTGGVQGQQTYPITLTVGGGGGVVTGGVAPSSLTFAYQTGVNDQVPPQVVTVGGTGPISVQIPTNSPWLNATGSGQAPGTVTVSVIPNLPQGTYNGTINIGTSTGTSQVGVTFIVSSSPVISADPIGSINQVFGAGSTPFTTVVTITSSDNLSNLPVSVSSGASWVTVTNPTGNSTTPTSFNLTVNPAGLANGLNATNVTVTATGAANSPMVIPVVALVTGSSGGGTGVLTLNPSSLTFSGAVNGTQPASQSLFVSAATQTSFQVNTSGATWLSISPVAGSNLVTNQTITVTVNTTGLAANTYSASILLTANGVTQTVPVTLVVGGSGGGGNVSVAPTSLSFSSNAGSSPGVQGLTINSTTGSPVTATITATTQSGGNWLSPGITSGGSVTTPTTLNVSVNVTGLASGTYNGTITVSPSGGTQIAVPVTLTVTTNTVSATTSSGTSLTFTYRVGDSTPNTQPISVTGNGTFTATATSTGTWLTVSPSSGSAPATLDAGINTSGLGAGTYNGTIVVAGSGTTSGSTTISVSLTVTAPLPSVLRVTNAASYLSGSIAPGEVITLFGTNIGPSPGVGLALDPATGRVATTIGGVQVLVNGFLAPMVFASSQQVSAVVPYEVKGQLSGNVQVRYLGQTSNVVTVPVAATAPGVFTANASGTGPAAIIYPNPTLASATRGDVIAIYTTGEGETNPPGVTGKVTTVSATPPITPEPVLRSSLVVLIDGQPAEIQFAGEAPGIVSGVMQVNVRIPANARSGDLPLTMSIGGVSSQPGVTVAVR